MEFVILGALILGAIIAWKLVKKLFSLAVFITVAYVIIFVILPRVSSIDILSDLIGK